MVLLVNFPAPTEGVHHSEPNTKAYFGAEELGKGTLYISESVLCWLSSSGDGFSLKYPSIYMHAVSKDTSNFPEACIYLMIDGKITLGQAPEPQDPQELANAMDSMTFNGDEGDDDTSELRFVPEKEDSLDTIFRAMLDCQALNPDPADVDDDDDDGGVVIAPSFKISYSNGASLEEDFEDEDEEEDEDEMNEEQFEDAEA